MLIIALYEILHIRHCLMYPVYHCLSCSIPPPSLVFLLLIDCLNDCVIYLMKITIIRFDTYRVDIRVQVVPRPCGYQYWQGIGQTTTATVEFGYDPTGGDIPPTATIDCSCNAFHFSLEKSVVIYVHVSFRDTTQFSTKLVSLL